MNTKLVAHTPGPWKISSLDARTVGPERGLTAYGTTVTQLQAVARVTERTGQSEANARLIAAAPELYDALRALFDDYKRLADSGDAGNWHLEGLAVGQQALAAIAKAEGR